MSEAKLHFPFYSFMLLKGIALGLFALISIFYALFLCFPAVTQGFIGSRKRVIEIGKYRNFKFFVCAMKAYVGVEIQLRSFLVSALGRVIGQLHLPASLLPGKDHLSAFKWKEIGPQNQSGSLGEVTNFVTCRELKPDPYSVGCRSLVTLSTDLKYSIYIQGVSRLQGITAGGDFLGLCDQKSSYKYVSDFGRLRSYGHFLIPVHAFV